MHSKSLGQDQVHRNRLFATALHSPPWNFQPRSPLSFAESTPPNARSALGRFPAIALDKPMRSALPFERPRQKLHLSPKWLKKGGVLARERLSGVITTNAQTHHTRPSRDSPPRTPHQALGAMACETMYERLYCRGSSCHAQPGSVKSHLAGRSYPSVCMPRHRLRSRTGRDHEYRQLGCYSGNSGIQYP